MPAVPKRRKVCTACKTSKVVDNFVPHKTGVFGVTPRCRSCLREVQKVSLASVKRQMVIAERVSLLNDLRSRPCSDCGGTFPTVCMDFDHRDPSDKHSEVTSLAFGRLDTLLAEIDKCDIVCANCHRIRTAKGRANGTIKTYKNGRPRKEDIT